MPKLLKPVEQKSPFLNRGIKDAHKLLARELSDPKRRKKTQISILNARRRDVASTDWCMSRRLFGAHSYDFFDQSKNPTLPVSRNVVTIGTKKKGRKINIPEIIKELISKRAGKVRVLDVGAGHGNALADLKTIFKGEVELHAMSAGVSEQLKQKLTSKQIDAIHQVAIEAWLPKQEYDLIMSHTGGLVYTSHPQIAIQKIAHSLSVGGIALLHFDYEKIDFETLAKALERDRFVVKRLTGAQLQITRIR